MTITFEGRLKCSFQPPPSGDASSSLSSNKILWFRPNEGKRSSFMLDMTDDNDNTPKIGGGMLPSPTIQNHHCVIPEAPCHCYIECVMNDNTNNNNDDYFFLGGFQLISSARQVQVYVTRHGCDQEEFLMSCRGIPVRDNTCNEHGLSDCFKVFSVVPGGPRPVKQLRLHLLPIADSDSLTISSTPSSFTSTSSPTSAGGGGATVSSPTAKTTKLISIQLTGRIPEPQQQQHQQQQQQVQVTPSSAMMMQQMLMASHAAATTGVGTPSGAFHASTPLASGGGGGGSNLRNPFFSPPSASSSSDRQLPPTPTIVGGAAGMQSPTPNPPSFMMMNSGRPMTSSPSQNATASHNFNASYNTTTQNTNSNSTEAILAGVSFLVRSEGQATVQLMQQEIQKQQHAMQHQFHAMEQKLQHQQSMFESMMHQQQSMIQRQYEMMAMLQQQQQQQQQQMQWLALSHHYQQPPPPQQQHQQMYHQLTPNMGDYQEQQQRRNHSTTTNPLEGTTTTPPAKNQTSIGTSLSSNAVANESSYDPTCRINLCDANDDTALEQRQNNEREHVDNDETAVVVEVEDKDQDVSRRDNGVVSETEDDDDDASERNDKRNKKNADHGDFVEGPVDDNGNDDEDDGGSDYTNHSSSSNGESEDKTRDDDGTSSSSRDNGHNGKGRNQDNRDRKHNDEDRNKQRGGKVTDYMEIGATIETYGTKSETTCDEDEGQDEKYDYHNEAIGSSTQAPCYAVMTKQLVFHASKKGVFPVSGGDALALLRCASAPAPLYNDQLYATMSQDYIPFVEKNASMMDHLSIRFCNTGATELPSLLSGEASTEAAEVDQEESIEVLAVFQDSPNFGADSAAAGTPTSSSSSPVSKNSVPSASSTDSSRGLALADSTGNAHSFTEGGRDSYDDEDDERDLVSVSLQESENENLEPRVVRETKPVSILRNGKAKTGDDLRATMTPTQRDNVIYF